MIDVCTVDAVKVGDRFKFNAINWKLISAKSMAPDWRYLEVVAVTDTDIWYRFDNETEVKQTSFERWDEITKTSFHHQQADLQKVY